MMAKNFHVTRSYCLSSTPVSHTHSRFGVKVCNHVFSNMAATTDITSNIELAPSTDTAEAYRRGYWSTGKDRWDHKVTPLGRHDETALTRRQAAQSSLLPNSPNLRLQPKPSTLIEKRIQQSEKRKARRNARKESPSSSSSSSSSRSSVGV